MDEKKKLIVVVVLVAVIACVGAFQFLGGSKAPPPAVKDTKPQADSAAPAETTPAVIKNPQVANDLPARDPFSVPFGDRPIIPSAHPTMAHINKAGKGGYGGSKGYQPLPLGSTELNKISALPSPGANKALDDKPFDYKIVGTIGGVRPEVLVEDSTGNQKLVPVGSAIDGDSRVRGVENGAVTIEHRGKKLRLTVGGNPGGK